MIENPPETKVRAVLLVLLALMGLACGKGSSGGGQLYVDRTAELGVEFRHQSGAPAGNYQMPEVVCGGVAVFDHDGDGRVDLYFSDGGDVLGKGSPNRLFRQLETGRFEDATEASGLGDEGYGFGAAVADIDNDGDLDVQVSNLRIDGLYLNDGSGRFRDVAPSYGYETSAWSTSAVFSDLDRDGYLDLFVCQYVQHDPEKRCFSPAGEHDYCGPRAFLPLSDRLFHNQQGRGFDDISSTSGIISTRGAGLGVISEDLSDDGWPDLYVANDGYANNLWVNQGNLTFLDDAMLAGVALNFAGHAEAGMGLAAADLDDDADIDIFVTHLTSETNTFYEKTGRGTSFVDATGRSGLSTSSLIHTGFGVWAFDAEHDGDLDLAIANGRVLRGKPNEQSDAPDPWNTLVEPNLFYENDGAGEFTVSRRARVFSDRLSVTRGVVPFDLDDDGDLDLVVTNTEEDAQVLENVGADGAWLRVRAFDPRLNRDAIGAELRLVAGGRVMLRTIKGGSGYLNAAPAEAHFGLSDLESAQFLEVRWPDGLKEEHDVPGLNRQLVVERGAGRDQP
ncbi:MAG: CRTAC1 family protein [Acidobacteriota bacterium]